MSGTAPYYTLMGPQGVRGQWTLALVRLCWPDAPLRYVGVCLADSEPVDGPPSSAHDEQIMEDGRLAGPAGGRAFARDLRKPTCGCAALPTFQPSGNSYTATVLTGFKLMLGQQSGRCGRRG